MGEISDRITQIIQTGFNPQYFELFDESDRHAGHAGHDGRGESHFRMIVVSAAFSGKTRIERHRMVFSALDDLMRERIHALTVKALTPEEHALKI